MAFGSISPGDRIRITLQVIGGPKYVTEMRGASAATMELGKASKIAGLEASAATKKTFAYQQAVFTLRRVAFYTTLGILGLAAAAVKMGFDFDSSMQNARVAFSGFIPTAAGVNKELKQIYLFGALTPFQFPDLLIATRRLLPFVGSLKMTNELVHAIGDSLAAVGIVSGSSLTRATLQLAHMNSIGRLTGQVLYALGRDNIPMQKALEAAYHATGLQIKGMVTAGLISATAANQALIQYTQNTPGYINKAVAFSKKSVSGAFSTFKDLVRIAFGSSQQGIFDQALVRLNKINEAVYPLVRGDKPITITNLAMALDHALTPSTHAVGNAFIILATALSDVWNVMKLIIGVITFVINSMNKLTGVVGGSSNAAKFFGHMLALLIIAFIVIRTITGTYALGLAAYEAATNLATIATILYAGAVWLLNTAFMVATGRFIIAQGSIDIVQASLFKLRRFILTGMIPALTELAIAVYANPLFWPVLIIAAVVALVAILVVLYYKWKWFHDLVVDTATWFYKHWLWAGLMFAALAPELYVLVLAVKYWNDIKDALNAVVNAAKAVFHWFSNIFSLHASKGHGLMSLLGNYGYMAAGPFAPVLQAGLNLIGHASGGIQTIGGLAMVGEAGPEVVHLPMGSRVNPVPNASGVLDASSGGNGQPIVIQLMLNRKVLEEAVVDIQNRRNARA